MAGLIDRPTNGQNLLLRCYSTPEDTVPQRKWTDGVSLNAFHQPEAIGPLFYVIKLMTPLIRIREVSRHLIDIPV